MPRYRRFFVPGGTVFFTVCLAPGCGLSLVDRIDLLRWSVAVTRRERPFEVLGWTVLPNSMHAIWRLPPGDSAYAVRWGAIKARFNRSLAEAGHRPCRRADGAASVWQKRFWEHHVRGPDDLAAHLEYCRRAPVDAGLVTRAEDWPFSSFAKARQAGTGRAEAPPYGADRPGDAEQPAEPSRSPETDRRRAGL